MSLNRLREQCESLRSNAINNARVLGLDDEMVLIVSEMMTKYGELSMKVAESIIDPDNDITSVTSEIFGSAKEDLLENDQILSFLHVISEIAEKYEEMELSRQKLYLDVASSYVSHSYKVSSGRKLLAFSFMSMCIILSETLDNACEMRDEMIVAGERAIISNALMGADESDSDKYMKRWREIEGIEDDI